MDCSVGTTRNITARSASINTPLTARSTDFAVDATSQLEARDSRAPVVDSIYSSSTAPKTNEETIKNITSKVARS